MRRKDLEITEFDEIVKIMQSCDVCRLAINDVEYPYIVPLNFGMTVENGEITLYFHSAKIGKKLDLIRKNNRVAFEMDCEHQLVTELEKGDCTMKYKSVIGNGLISFVEDENKLAALKILMAHYHQEEFAFNTSYVPHTAVYKLVVNEVTGKER